MTVNIAFRLLEEADLTVLRSWFEEAELVRLPRR